MGPEVALTLPEMLSIGSTALGFLMKSGATNDAQQRSDAAFRANMLRDQQYQDKAIQLVNQNAEQYRPEQRQQAEQAATDSATNSITTNLLAARDSAAPGAVSGRVSSDYTTDRAARTASELQRSTDLAKLFARVRGPNDLRAGEAVTNADFAARGGSLAADRGFMSQAGGMDAQVAGRPNGTSMLLGDALMNGGTGVLASSLAKRAGALGSVSPVASGINWDIV